MDWHTNAQKMKKDEKEHETEHYGMKKEMKIIDFLSEFWFVFYIITWTLPLQGSYKYKDAVYFEHGW